jgi:hypothetical protein
LIIALKNRIKILEDIIRENGLQMPSDEVLAQIAQKLGQELDDHIEVEDEDEDVEEEEYKEDQKSDSDEELFVPQNQQPEEIISTENSMLDDGTTPEFIDEEQQAEAKKIKKLVESSSSDNKNNQQDIINKFLALQEQLRQERHNHNVQIDLMSNMKEDSEVLKTKIKKTQCLNDELINANESIEIKIRSYKEKAEEAENDLILKSTKLDKVENELAEIKKLYLNAKNKIDRFQEKGTEFLLEESKNNDDFRKESHAYNEEIKTELLNLHNQIQERDMLISKIQQNPDITSDIRSIIEDSHAKLFEAEKESIYQFDNPEFKRFLLGDGKFDRISPDSSCYFNPDEVASVVAKQKETKSKMDKDKKKISKLKKELNTMKIQITKDGNIDKLDLEAITDAMVEDRIYELSEKFNMEREKIMHDLSNRIDKVCDLELQLD